MELENKRKTYDGVIRCADENRITTDEENIGSWTKQFQNALNCGEPEVLITLSGFWTEQTISINNLEVAIFEVRCTRCKQKSYCSPSELLDSREKVEK